jgi:hypothetical protein
MSDEKSIGQSLHGFQSALIRDGESLENFITKTYSSKWTGDALFHAMAIRTTFVNAMHTFPTDYGLFNMERALYALCRGKHIAKVDDITLFGKNPDSHPLYLF